MTKRIPAHIREQQINNLPNITFVRWDGEYRNKYSKATCRCDVDGFEWSASVNELLRNDGTGCPQCAGVRRWTADERIEQIDNLPNVSFVCWDGDYRNARSKAVCRCDVDGFEWSASVGDLLNGGRGCPQCGGQRRWTADERTEQINNLPNITFVRWDGEFTGAFSKAVCRCDVDGFEWSARADHLINRGTRCPQCAGNRRWTADERIEQIDNLTGITFVRWDGEYNGAFSKTICRCDVDGFEWSASVSHLLNGGSGCPQCAEYGYNPSKPGTLYALRSECGTMVKIGISNDYKQRHRRLARATPFEWSCIELLHGDGALIVSLEKAFHGMTEPVTFSEPFDGYTEWRKWTPELTNWFSTWKSLTPKENENV